ncbi:LysR family transcriptional regulator [Gemmobacter fulvus]|uniref:LysR family transcriptional regulator n=1 Tax=Gemmobacter fulvus TaxID=2840474 RepID=A0A975P5E2_9RHOB|nr:LysR family transcriptional regulator [Gemmobacter fulvus]MBT9246906.1 LysR family transcriptional regulator [Gemmobacter fulvus]QWK89682.1 LysR family transcriptional regulator [Gemmobacter fulvus]
MATPRRLLPSISLLMGFESVLRTGSTLAAAQDLSLTQGAVSRLIQNLEAQLGVQLFRREGRRLVPTENALAYGRDVAKAMDLISRASMRVRSNTGGGTLALSILPTFGTRWLAPRLPRFLAQHPGVTINLGTRLRPFDFAEEGFDAAIHFGEPTWPEAGFAKLFDERMVACCAPGFLASHPVRGPGDLAGLPLLQLETRPNAWAGWFAHHGVSASVPLGMLFDQFAPMIQSAIYGMGIALLPEFLAKAELADGRLVDAWGGPVPSAGSYYLVWPGIGEAYPPLVAFRDWLLTAVAGGMDEELLAW